MGVSIFFFLNKEQKIAPQFSTPKNNISKNINKEQKKAEVKKKVEPTTLELFMGVAA